MRSSSRPPINMAWLWCSPAYATSGIRLGSQEIEHLDERSLAAVVQRSISWGAMKVLIVGAGGREHALAWKCAASPRVTSVLVAPGNAGTAAFTRDSVDAAWLRSQRAPLVVKASGLAAGKGVVIAPSIEEARTAAQAMFAGQFGEAGREVVIEEFLPGEEASFIVMADGTHSLPLASSQDHKRRDDGDRGPNTGGMGAYSPAPVVTPALHTRIMREVIEPTVRGLSADGTPYTGFLYAGLMIAPDGTPRVLEFNCRLGDPETQPILMRLESDLTTLCEAALGGRLDALSVQWDPRAALGVVMAAAGYPERVRKGDVIEGLERAAQLPGKIFHAGTRLEAGRVLTNGGRVLTATALGASVGEAQRAAYALADTVRWSGVQYRRDIGHRAVERERAG